MNRVVAAVAALGLATLWLAHSGPGAPLPQGEAAAPEAPRDPPTNDDAPRPAIPAPTAPGTRAGDATTAPPSGGSDPDPHGSGRPPRPCACPSGPEAADEAPQALFGILDEVVGTAEPAPSGNGGGDAEGAHDAGAPSRNPLVRLRLLLDLWLS